MDAYRHKTGRHKTGPFSRVDALAQKLLRRWVAKWYGAFAQDGSPLFHERLGHAFLPVATGRKRLLSQLRQLAMYAHAAAQPESFLFRPALERHFEGIVAAYAADERGAWAFALDETGHTVTDPVRDLYTHAFVLFAFAHYGRTTGDARARERALATAGYIDSAFRKTGLEGFVEALHPDGSVVAGRPRRHESHMHLLEGCLFAASVWGDPAFMALADELVDLFFTRFYQPETNVLSEYFTDALMPAPDAAKGCVVCEPGHYYEWIWLLKKHALAKGEPARYDAVCLRLLDWANENGWDARYGGLYDELGPDARVVTDTKRLWPLTEGLKANALMLDATCDPVRDAIKRHIGAMTQVFLEKYMQKRGFWCEWLTRELVPASDYMPATTPYHVYFGIMETRGILGARGHSKSWGLVPARLFYAIARGASALVLRLRRRR